MIQRFVYRGVEWIDLESPTYEEVIAISKERGLNRVIAEELSKPSIKPKVDLYRDYLYLVLHFPAVRQSHSGSMSQEVDFVVGKNFLITTHYDTVDPLHEFSKIFEVNAILDRSDFGEHAGYIFYYMLRHIYKGTENELENISEYLNTVEAAIFSGKEKDMVEKISHLGRDILDIKGILRPHRHILDSLTVAAVQFFGESFSFPMRAISNEYHRINNDVTHVSDLVAELRQTNNSLVSTRQNEIMKILTIMAFVTFPLSLIAGIFGMNTDFNPIVGMPFDFWVVIGIMAGLTSTFFIFFKYKKWL